MSIGISFTNGTIQYPTTGDLATDIFYFILAFLIAAFIAFIFYAIYFKKIIVEEQDGETKSKDTTPKNE